MTTNAELIAKANAVSTNDVVANPRRYRNLIGILADALEKTTRELEEARGMIGARVESERFTHGQATEFYQRAKQAEAMLAKVRELANKASLIPERAKAMGEVRAILDESASRPAPTRQLRECTMCGEKVPMSHATDEWERLHTHTEDPAPIEAGEREALVEIIAKEIYGHSETDDPGETCMGCDARVDNDLAKHQAEVVLGILARRAPIEDAEPKKGHTFDSDDCITDECDCGQTVDDAEPVAWAWVEKATGRINSVSTSALNTASLDAPMVPVPLYRHPAAPIEVTDEALIAAMNVFHGYEPPVTDIAYWSEGYRANIRAGITAVFKEMGKSNG